MPVRITSASTASGGRRRRDRTSEKEPSPMPAERRRRREYAVAATGPQNRQTSASVHAQPNRFPRIHIQEPAAKGNTQCQMACQARKAEKSRLVGAFGERECRSFCPRWKHASATHNPPIQTTYSSKVISNQTSLHICHMMFTEATRRSAFFHLLGRPKLWTSLPQLHIDWMPQITAST